MLKNHKPRKILTAFFAAAAVFVLAGAGAFAVGSRSFCYTPVTAQAAEGVSQLALLSVKAETGMASHRIGDHNYNSPYEDINTGYHAETGKSALSANADGTFTRAEYVNNGETVNKLLIENYTADFKLKSKKTIALTLPVFGGIFCGENYNFVVNGKENPDESETAEVVRVIKFSKDWKRLGSVSLRGKNTYIPFDAGTVSMDESNGKLFIHTCRLMFLNRDGHHHQANMTFFVDQETLAVEYEHYHEDNWTSGYITHSFNQVVRSDGNYVYTVDHGDAALRGMILVRRMLDGSDVKYKNILPIRGITGANKTKATLGDIQLTDSNVLTVGVSVGQDDNYDSNTQRNVFLCVTSKDDIASNKLIWLTNYAEGAGYLIGNPYIVKTGSNRFTVMWEEYKENDSCLKCAVVNGSGARVGSVYSFTEGAGEGLSDCKPIVAGGNFVWYSTGLRDVRNIYKTESVPVFYRLPVDLSSVSFIKITQQPGDVTVKSGEKATFTVKATGKNLKYQWYYKKKGEKTWKKWGTRTTASTTATSNDTWNGMQVYCGITDYKGEVVDSRALTITVIIPIRIQSQPADVTVNVGDKATFAVKATGTGLKYQWYYKKKNETTWKKWGTRTTASTTAVSNATWDGMQVYCELSDANGAVLNSDPATITLTYHLTISTQPKDGTATEDEKYTFSVKANGLGLQYQWYYKKANQTAWHVWNGRTHATETSTANATWGGMQIRCLVSDSSGDSLYSSAATITLQKKLKIITQPANVEAFADEMFTVSVKASGDGLQYKWYKRRSAFTTYWSVMSDETGASFTAQADVIWHNMEVYCRVTDAYGNYVDTDIALITVTIFQDRSFVSGKTTIVYTLSQDTEDYTFKWYYKKKDDSEWKEWPESEFRMTLDSTCDGMLLHYSQIGTYGKDINPYYYRFVEQ